MLDVILVVLSVPFWFAATMLTVVGIFGSVKVNGVKLKPGKDYWIIKACAVMAGIIFGMIAYAMV